MKICQSCGMPLRRDKDFGTNSDNNMNFEYCFFCYRDGKFTDEGISMEDKIKKNIELAKRMGMPEETAVEMAETTIPTLKRWKARSEPQ